LVSIIVSQIQQIDNKSTGLPYSFETLNKHIADTSLLAAKPTISLLQWLPRQNPIRLDHLDCFDALPAAAGGGQCSSSAPCLLAWSLPHL